MLPDDPDLWRVLEEMRQDEALLRLFMRTETRLLEDIGVDPQTIGRIEQSLSEVLVELQEVAEPSEDRLRELVEVFEASLLELEEQGRHHDIVARLTGVVQTLGGALLVGVNGAAGVGTAAATMGVTTALSAAGAAVSIAAGGEVMTRGASKALGN
jgi:transcriptional regulator with XRE-family HTH domain